MENGSAGGRSRFRNPPLQSMLAIGQVTTQAARIWMRVPEPGHYRLSWSGQDGESGGRCWIPINSRSRDYTASQLIDTGIHQNSRYEVKLEDEQGSVLSEGSFRTPAETMGEGDEEAVALISCHQPFDSEGYVRDEAREMLTALGKACEAHGVNRIILGGDQLYSDQPASLSLFDPEYFATVSPGVDGDILQCSADEVRALFHQRYRHFWNIAEWKQLLANYSCIPILDDHDIVDNWGSSTEHLSPKWNAFRRGAFLAYLDYQGSLLRAHADLLPVNFDFQAAHAESALYVLDLRSNRRVGKNPGIVSDGQLEQLQHFLRENANKPVIYLALSVPPVHLPKLLSRLVAFITPEGEDFSDRWSSRGHVVDRDRLFRIIHTHQLVNPRQKLVLLSGDVHIGCLHQLSWNKAVPNLYQLVSSGITHNTGKIVQRASSAIMRLKRNLRITDGPSARVELVKGKNNPCSGMNFAIVSQRYSAQESESSLDFYLYSHRRAEPECRFHTSVEL